MITARTGTSVTSIARGTINIMYGFLISLELSNRGWWGGGVIQGHISASTANSTTVVGGGGKFIAELDIAEN